MYIIPWDWTADLDSIEASWIGIDTDESIWIDIHTDIEKDERIQFCYDSRDVKRIVDLNNF